MIYKLNKIMGKKRTHKEYISEVKIIHPYIDVLGTYIDARTPILHRCVICDHEWYAWPDNILHGHGCRKCAAKTRNQKQTKSHDKYIFDAYNINPNVEVLEKYINNKTKILHRCKICGYEWHPTPSYILEGHGCPQCEKCSKVSNSEMRLYFYLKKYFNDAISGYQDKNNGLTELDVYIPSLKYGFEFDGSQYHQDVKKDLYKDKVCKSLDIKLIRIREPNCPQYESECIFIYLSDSSQKELEFVIRHTLKMIGVENPRVEFDKDIEAINNLIAYKQVENSLMNKFPSVATEWHPIKNGNLQPNYVASKSNKKAWWKCKRCGYEWVAEIVSRTDGGCGCPQCAGCLPKIVYCTEFNKVFKSLSDGSRQTGVQLSHIVNNCRKKRKSAGKHPVTNERLHWYYVFDQQLKDGTIIPGAITLGIIEKEEINSQLATQDELLKGETK